MIHETCAEMRARLKAEQRREMRVFAVLLAVGLALLADFALRGAGSLYGRLFCWLATL